jgi:hypothetical protein
MPAVEFSYRTPTVLLAGNNKTSLAETTWDSGLERTRPAGIVEWRNTINAFDLKSAQFTKTLQAEQASRDDEPINHESPLL